MGKRKAAVLSALLLVWAGAIVGGLKALGEYANAPGEVGQPMRTWPSNAVLKRPTDHKPTLVLFLHPKCSCSRASVGELDALMARTSGKAHVYAVFVQPQGWSEAETIGKLWKQAASIPGVTPLLDHEGKEARRFGALTSGHLFIFDNAGQLAFTGGITTSRGHRGDNPGLQAAVQFVNSGVAPIKQSKVFGCSLFKAHEKLVNR